MTRQAQLARLNAYAGREMARRIADTFDVFRVHTGSFDPGKAEWLATVDALADAVDAAALRGNHKDIVCIRCRSELTGDEVLKFYAIRQGKPVWRKADPFSAHVVQARKQYADHLFDLKTETLG